MLINRSIDIIVVCAPDDAPVALWLAGVHCGNAWTQSERWVGGGTYCRTSRLSGVDHRNGFAETRVRWLAHSFLAHANRHHLPALRRDSLAANINCATNAQAVHSPISDEVCADRQTEMTERNVHTRNKHRSTAPAPVASTRIIRNAFFCWLWRTSARIKRIQLAQIRTVNWSAGRAHSLVQYFRIMHTLSD